MIRDEEHAALAVKTHYSMGPNKTAKDLVEKQIKRAEELAAKYQKWGKRLEKGGKALGVAGAVFDTGNTAWGHYKNCDDLALSINDTAATGLANALMLAAPPLAGLDLVTGGGVTGFVGNGLKTPGTLAKLAGRVTSRDADTIKGTYTSFPLGRFLWSVGEYIAGD